MALPKQVQAQIDAVEEFEKQVAEARAADEPKPESPPEQPTDSPQPEAQPREPEATDPVKQQDEDPAVWRQRYLSLQGQYNSQVPTLQRQVQQLTDTVSQLTEQLQASQQQKAVEEPEVSKSDLVTKDDVETFGADLVDLARRIADEQFGKRESKYIRQIEALEEQLAEAKGQVGEVAQSQAQSAAERFFTDLDSTVPGWEQIQAAEESQAWLTSRIPGTSVTWDAALKDAAARRDIGAVKEVFDALFERHPHLDPKAKQRTNPARQELQRQVAPGKSSATNTTPQSRRSYTGADYQAESLRLLRLMKSGQIEEAGRLEAELNAALAEGRVTP